MGRNYDLIKSYQKAIDLMRGNQFEKIRKQIQTLIDNVRAGKSNNDPANLPADSISPNSDNR